MINLFNFLLVFIISCGLAKAAIVPTPLSTTDNVSPFPGSPAIIYGKRLINVEAVKSYLLLGISGPGGISGQPETIGGATSQIELGRAYLRKFCLRKASDFIPEVIALSRIAEINTKVGATDQALQDVDVDIMLCQQQGPTACPVSALDALKATKTKYLEYSKFLIASKTFWLDYFTRCIPLPGTSTSSTNPVGSFTEVGSFTDTSISD